MKKIFIAGHNGMVGSAIYRKLSKNKNLKIITKSREELDLTNQSQVKVFFEKETPDEVYLAAAKVGGIFANKNYPADFIYQNLQIQNNVIHYAHLNGIQKLLFLGSSCIYPKFSFQPIREEYLLSGFLEDTNEPYAIAKIAGIKICESYNRQYGRDYRSVMPTNLYGIGDNYHPDNSHVIAGLIRRFHEAKVNNLEYVIVWGTGAPKREFLHVDDMADACVFIHNISNKIYLENTDLMLSHINIGCGEDISIRDLAEIIKSTVGYKGKIKFDRTKPDGTPRKLMNIDLLTKLGWSPKISLKNGLSWTYSSYLL